eukprot:2737542-Prymnesium_polylepis.2
MQLPPGMQPRLTARRTDTLSSPIFLPPRSSWRSAAGGAGAFLRAFLPAPPIIRSKRLSAVSRRPPPPPPGAAAP